MNKNSVFLLYGYFVLANYCFRPIHKTIGNYQLFVMLQFIQYIFPRLKERVSQLAGTLSGGEQQMLAVGRAYMSGRRLMLLDEPSMGLAPLLMLSMFDALKKINREGTTILLVEQNARLALKFAQRAYVLENGRLVLKGPSQDLLNNPEVKKAYLGG